MYLSYEIRNTNSACCRLLNINDSHFDNMGDMQKARNSRSTLRTRLRKYFKILFFSTFMYHCASASTPIEKPRLGYVKNIVNLTKPKNLFDRNTFGHSRKLCF